jgi:raffinose/stachyose/melibiose transport system permease protein
MKKAPSATKTLVGEAPPPESPTGKRNRSLAAGFKRLYHSGTLTTLLLFLPPALVIFTMFVILPVGEASYFSFFNWNGYGAPHKWIDFENYVRVFNDPIFRQSLINNLLVIAVSAFIQVPLALWVALLIADRTRFSLVFRAIFFVPYILADVVAGLIWRYLYDGDYGLVGTVFRWFGHDGPAVLAETGWATAALLLVVVWKYFGFHMALFIAGRQNVPYDVIESARIDGASRWKITRFVVLPLMRPVVVLSLFFSLLGSLQLFDLIIALTGGGPLNSSHSVVSYLYTFGIRRMRVGFGSAVGVVLFVICVLVMLFYKRLFMREAQTK